MGDKSIGISELVASIGDDNIKIQSLDSCMMSLSKHKGLTKISFLSDQPISGDTTSDIGIVMWIGRDAARKILES